jgi:NAD(P)-dependent dehydrogenase (short-subunit alcohol dehydrogenase family)
MAVVVITGCSSGLGPLMALAFARRGDRVYATLRGSNRGQELIDTAAAEGLGVRVLELDVTDDVSVQRAIDHVLDAEGRIDVLVNNAGLLHFGSVELLSDELMRSTFDTNVFGTVRMLRAVLPAMRAQRSGVVVNVSSVAGRVPAVPIVWSYMASKHALSVLSDALALELEPFGIRVISIEPGWFKTEIVAKACRPPDGDSPYRTLDAAVVALMEGVVACGVEAGAVADAVVDAVENDAGRTHILVGYDAEFVLDQYQSLSEPQMTSFYKQLIGIKAPTPVG